MNFIVPFFIVLAVASGLIAATFILLTKNESSGILNSGSGAKFMPGSVDAFKNKAIGFLIFVFIVSIIAANAIYTRQKNKQRIVVEEKPVTSILPSDDDEK